MQVSQCLPQRIPRLTRLTINFGSTVSGEQLKGIGQGTRSLFQQERQVHSGGGVWGETEEVRPGLSVDEHGGTGTLRVKKKKTTSLDIFHLPQQS